MPALFIRDIPRETVDYMKKAAGSRGWTLALYVSRLVELHHRIRYQSDLGNEPLNSLLIKLGLETVKR